MSKPTSQPPIENAPEGGLPKKAKPVDPRRAAREFAFQFLYQCEMEKIYYFSESHFQSFVEHTQVPAGVKQGVRTLAESALDDLPACDQLIESHLQHWSLDRLATIERCILRLSCGELALGKAPPKVVINEAIELAKKFGTADSFKFVNGILNRVVQDKLSGVKKT